MITVIGIDGRGLDEPALAALAKARLVVGGRRHLDAVAHLLPAAAATKVIDGDLRATLDAIAATDGDRVVLASGDPGYFGIVRAVRAEHDDVRIVAAASSVAAAFAAAGVAWDDAHVVSAHARPPHRAVNVCRRFPKVAVLTEPAFGPAELAGALTGLSKRFVVAERLGGSDERVTALPAADAATRQWADPNVVVVLDEDVAPGAKGWSAPPRWTADRWALPDDAFDHRDGMVTKAEVRAVALAWLGPGLGDLVWDVGAGSGSVAVECARLGAAVVAVDADAQQCERVARNADRHGVPVAVVAGPAPTALADLPDPDAVFVGGGGHLLTEIVRTAAERVRRCVVVALATLERIAPVRAALCDAGLTVDATVVSAARLAPLGDGTRLAATNPVVLLRGGVR